MVMYLCQTSGSKLENRFDSKKVELQKKVEIESSQINLFIDIMSSFKKLYTLCITVYVFYTGRLILGGPLGPKIPDIPNVIPRLSSQYEIE